MHISVTLKQNKQKKHLSVSATDLSCALSRELDLYLLQRCFSSLPSLFTSLLAAIKNSFVNFCFYNILFIQEQSVLGGGGAGEESLAPACLHNPRFMQIPLLKAERVAPCPLC